MVLVSDSSVTSLLTVTVLMSFLINKTVVVSISK